MIRESKTASGGGLFGRRRVPAIQVLGECARRQSIGLHPRAIKLRREATRSTERSAEETQSRTAEEERGPAKGEVRQTAFEFD